MQHVTLKRLLALLLTLGLFAAACGSDDEDTTSTDGEDTTETTAADDGADPESDDTTDETTDDSMDEESGDEMAAVSLAEVCPSPLVVQTDWNPESEHGALYELIGEGYTLDTEKKVARGPMVLAGQDLGIEFEVRAGGPAIGFSPVASYVYTDDSIHLAYANTESQVLNYADAPLLSVVAPLEKNPQMIMWDPETYPEIETLADLGTEGVTINVFGGGVFSEVFVAQDIWSADQVDPSYDGLPARFVAEGGAIAQQGFASAEPYVYENEVEDWGKPVAFQLLHDAGFEVYSQTIAIRPADKESLDACLKAVVPVIQEASINYAANPDRANAIIIDAVEQYDTGWVYDEGLAAFSIEKQVELGLIGNGPNDTLGDMDGDRIQGVIDLMTGAGMDVPDITADDIYTNEYIDTSIGL